ncbi:MAG: DUF1641 domain-containing protein [Proteobacteria bacterium]|nr:DUF1641 domain-containing protein [Pseudomonadota bacterium]
MKNEELILQKISDLESQIEPLIRPVKRNQELKDDLMPLMNQATGLLINELLEVDSAFDLRSFFELIKQVMRSTDNLHYSLKTLGSFIDLFKDIEPLFKSGVPLLIGYLDELEKRGILRIIQSTLDIRAKVAQAYSAEDMDAIGDGFVVLLGLSKKLSDPKAIEFIDKLLDLPAQIDLTKVQSAGLGSLLVSVFNKEFKEGMGVLLELMKAMGKLK